MHTRNKCLYGYLYVRMYIRVYVCMYVCIYVRTCICRMYVCMYVYVCINVFQAPIHVRPFALHAEQMFELIAFHDPTNPIGQISYIHSASLFW